METKKKLWYAIGGAVSLQLLFWGFVGISSPDLSKCGGIDYSAPCNFIAYAIDKVLQFNLFTLAIPTIFLTSLLYAILGFLRRSN